METKVKLAVGYIDEVQGAVALDYQMVPVTGMAHTTLYTNEQKWAEPDLAQLRKAMRDQFEKQKLVGKTCKTFVENNWNLKTVGELMAQRLKEIEEL